MISVDVVWRSGNPRFSWLRSVARKLPCMQVRTGISTQSYGNFGLVGGEPGSVAKARPPGTCARSEGDTVTSPADQPDYAPVPPSALGPALNDQGYYVGRVERNLYWVTDGVYNSAFLTTPDGVVLFDA